MEFGRLIEYNMTNIFIEKSYAKCGWEASPSTFYKKSKLSIYLDQQSKMIQSLFLLWMQVLYQNMLKLRCWALVFSLYKILPV